MTNDLSASSQMPAANDRAGATMFRYFHTKDSSVEGRLTEFRDEGWEIVGPPSPYGFNRRALFNSDHGQVEYDQFYVKLRRAA